MKITILDGAVLNPGDVDWGPITALGDVTIYDETPADKLAERAKGVDVLLTNKTPLGWRRSGKNSRRAHGGRAGHGLQYRGYRRPGQAQRACVQRGGLRA